MPDEFDDLWRFVVKRSAGFPVVQEYHELKHVFGLIYGCKSYLEVGTAEGNSLYILYHALKESARIRYVDLGERHTKGPREAVIEYLKERGPTNIDGYLGNSHEASIMYSVIWQTHSGVELFDAVLIDAGHTYEDVIADASAYGWMASKYIIFHDICLPEVAKAFDWYCKQRPDCEAYKFINSETFGYGIMRIK